MTPPERADALASALRPVLTVLADPASSPDAVAGARGTLARVLALIDAIHPPDGPVPPEAQHPITRAHAHASEADRGNADDEARKEDGLHPLRAGIDQCNARRRDGEDCQAPAVKGTLICRRHGGAAPQVLIKARLTELRAARYDATADYEEAKGTPAELDAIGRWSRADRELAEYERKLERLAELRAQLKRSKAAALRAAPDDAPPPPAVASPRGRPERTAGVAQ